MAIDVGSVYVDLGARLDRSEFVAYEKELKKVQERTARREHFKAQLGANFDSRAFGAYERELKRADRANDNMVRSNGRLRTSFGSIWSKGGAAFAAAGGAYAVVTAVKSVVSAYGDAEASSKRVKTAVDNAGISYNEHAKQIDKVITAQSRLTKFDDEDLADTFARFVTQTKDVNEALRLNALAADVARGRQISLDAAQRLVARASQGNVGALKRLGIEIAPVTKATDKLKDSTNKASEAAKDQAKQHDLVATKQSAVAALQEKFGGQAKAYGKTQQGAIDGLRVSWENLREKLGEKLAPTITNITTRASRFIDQMTTGRGEGGKFARTLERDVLPALEQIGIAARTGGRLVGKFFEDFNSNERQVGGWITGFGRAEGAILDFGGHLPVIGGKLREWGRNVDRNADTIDRWRQELKITKEVDKIDSDIDRLRDKVSGTLRGIRISTKRNMDAIRDTMGEESAAGQQALHRNFNAAVTAIRSAMRRGDISTKTGMAQIRKEMQQELRTLGIDSAQRGGLPLSKNPPSGPLPVTTQAPGITKYGGGWIGAPGMVGPDTVPAMLAPGEAVLNRHQQAVIEGMLGGGFLDRLFATVQRPHFMQRGGRARRFFARGGDSGGRFLQLPESIHVTHQTAGLSGYPAEDIFASPGTSVGAPTAGTIARLSGQAGGPGGGGAFGYSIYENGANGRSYFLTHFGSTAVRAGQKVRRGDIIGTVADYPGGVPDHIHEGVHGGLTGITAGGPSGAAAAVRKAWKAIKAPRTGLSGLLGDVVQGTLNRTTRLANQRGRSLARSASTSGGGGGSDPAPRGSYSFGSLEDLWRGVGGASGAAAIMAHIALAESGGNPKARNPSGASGLWQILGLPFPGDPFDPATNARMAKSKSSNGSNLRPWDASRAAWGKFLARGGRIQRFASGGRPFVAPRGKVTSKPQRTTTGTDLKIRSLRGMQTDRVSNYDAIMGRVDDARNDYQRWDTRYNLTDEGDLIDQTTGEPNVAAINHKLKELANLAITRAFIEQQLREARTVVRRIVKTYSTIIGALQKSLRHTKGKDRSGIKSRISNYQGRLSEWQGKLKDVGGDIFEAHTDVLEIRGELKDAQAALGGSADIRAQRAADLAPQSDTGGGIDTGGGDTSGDTTAAAPSPLEIAEGVAKELATVTQGRMDLLTSFGRNFVPQSQAAGVFGAPDPLTAAAGLRNFGGAGTAGGLGGATIIANFASAPDNAPTFVQQIRFIAEGG